MRRSFDVGHSKLQARGQWGVGVAPERTTESEHQIHQINGSLAQWNAHQPQGPGLAPPAQALDGDADVLNKIPVLQLRSCSTGIERTRRFVSWVCTLVFFFFLFLHGVALIVSSLISD